MKYWTNIFIDSIRNQTFLYLPYISPSFSTSQSMSSVSPIALPNSEMLQSIIKTFCSDEEKSALQEIEKEVREIFADPEFRADPSAWTCKQEAIGEPSVFTYGAVARRVVYTLYPTPRMLKRMSKTQPPGKWFFFGFYFNP